MVEWLNLVEYKFRRAIKQFSHVTINNQQFYFSGEKGTVFPGLGGRLAGAEIPEWQHDKDQGIIQADLGFESSFE
jgi:hypothetical protein